MKGPFVGWTFKKLKHLLTILMVPLLSLSMVSCGKKNKVVVQKEQVPVPTVVEQPYSGPQNTINMEMTAQVQMVKNKYPCKNQTTRLEFQYYFPLNGAPTNTVPIVTLTPKMTEDAHGMDLGTISKTYMGIFPNYNDLLIVQNITSGTSTIGRMVTLSLCQLHPLIIHDRPLEISMATALNITENPYCVIGNVKGDFFLNAKAHYPYPPFPAPMRNVFINFPICEAQMGGGSY